MTGGVDPLLSKIDGGLTQPLPRLQQILRQIPCQRRLGRRPAIVRLPLLDPLFSVVALPAGLKQFLTRRPGPAGADALT